MGGGYDLRLCTAVHKREPWPPPNLAFFEWRSHFGASKLNALTNLLLYYECFGYMEIFGLQREACVLIALGIFTPYLLMLHDRTLANTFSIIKQGVQYKNTQRF